MIEITGKLEPRDYIRAQYLNLRPGPVYKIFGSLILAAVVWVLWDTLTSGNLEWTDYLFMAAIIYMILHFAVYVPWKTRRMYRQQKALQREVRMRFDEAGLYSETDNGQGMVPWGDYLKWKENDHLILLYLSDCLYQMVPKRFFADASDFDKVRLLIASQLGKSKS